MTAPAAPTAPASISAAFRPLADAAISGTANLVASVICRDTEALYQYVTSRISAAQGVRQVEISPVLRRVKQAGTWMAGTHLAATIPPRRRPRSPG